MELGHWQTKLDIPDDMIGFIYVITSPVYRKYIGKKICKFKTTKKPLKGRKNKRRGTKTSDWQTYTGSSKKLNLDIKKFGKDKFTFEIIKVCNSKSELAYQETVTILQANAIWDNQYYNEYLSCRLRNPK